MSRDDVRFTATRYTIAEGSRYLGVPYETFRKWVSGYTYRPRARPVVTGEPIIHAAPPRRGPRLTFASLVEGLVIAALRRAGFSLQTLRRVAGVLRDELGEEWALASRRLYVSGPDILWNFAEAHGDEEVLVAVDRGQRVFVEAVRDYLERIVYAEDDYAGSLYLPVIERRLVLVDPYRNYGQPIFQESGAPVAPALARLRAKEPFDDVARDYEVSPASLLAVRDCADAFAAA